ncbi:alpha/beta hydrolase family protein [Pseudoroseicyclus aestuarii]|uniref:Putative dienelactone hydrolase n=1 Tax=Pseudoroseicyclus aestuarii TaxID=1795041 RepID=A0A318T0A4_9RHOB|nr:hypothetical protein [Pseudoroseicyclus aestuarii]PYE86049.1 putative dienelactone hydrolase [Pseudoroseicyclus aestuarii]
MTRLTLLAALACAAAAPADAEMLPGYDRFDLNAAHRARPVAASLWYPAAGPTYRAPVGDGPLFEPSFAFIGPAVAEGPHPLVLLSHGSGGSADGLGWLSSGLVARGAMVLAVDHPGSTSGDSSPRRSTDLAARGADLTAALDAVLSDPAFAPFVDAERIGVFGFSLGGATALGLAGVRFDGAAQDRGCEAGPEAGDCRFFVQGGVHFADEPGFEAGFRDPRITRAAIVDPGFGGAVQPGSLETALAGITLINLGRAHRLAAADVGPEGNDLARRLPGADYRVIAPASHFTALAPCRPGGAQMLEEAGEDPICTDPPGASRADVHESLIEAVASALGL